VPSLDALGRSRAFAASATEEGEDGEAEGDGEEDPTKHYALATWFNETNWLEGQGESLPFYNTKCKKRVELTRAGITVPEVREIVVICLDDRCEARKSCKPEDPAQAIQDDREDRVCERTLLEGELDADKINHYEDGPQ